jgi:hypothetical protein
VVASGLEYTGDPVNALIQLLPGGVKVTVTIRGNDLAIVQPDGIWTGAADFLIATGNTESNRFNGYPDRLNLKLQPDVW